MAAPADAEICVLSIDSFYLRGLSECLTEAGYRVAAASETVSELVTTMQVTERPVLIVDPAIEDCDSYDACRTVKHVCNSAKVLLMKTADPRFEDVLDAYHVGVDAYLPARIQCEEMVRAIDAACRGYSLLPADSLTLAINDFRLTTREKSVVRLMAEDRTSGEIATDLGIRRTTVRNYIRNIMAKMDVHTTQAMIARARRRGLVD